MPLVNSLVAQLMANVFTAQPNPLAIAFVTQLPPPQHTHMCTQGAGLTRRGGVAIGWGAWLAQACCKSGWGPAGCQRRQQGGAASREEPQPQARPDWLGRRGGGGGLPLVSDLLIGAN